MRSAAVTVLSLAVLVAGDAAAACDGSDPGGSGPRVGLALSGGGARGLAHIGVLAVLEEAGVRVGCVAGTSMGAAIGALYAAGYSPARIETIARGIDWDEALSGRRKRTLIPLSRRLDDLPPVVRVAFDRRGLRLPPASDSDFRLNRMLFELLAGPGLAAGDDFDRLPVPFRAVAMDLHSGDRVVLREGELERAVRASMSTPVSLPPVPAGPRLLVDGGLLDNMPVDVVRAMGADVVVAVDATSPPLTPDRYRDAVGVATQVVDVLARARNEAFAAAADVTVAPALTGYSNQDYSDLAAIIEAGRRAARERLGELRALAGAAGPPAAKAAGSPAAVRGALAEVGVAGLKRVSVSVARHAFGLRPGEPFSMARTLDGLDRIWATGLFQTCWPEVDRVDGGLRLDLRLQEADPATLELGLAYDEADELGGFLRVRHRNAFGAGERIEAVANAGARELGLRLRLLGDRLWRSPVGFYVEAERADQEPPFFGDGIEVGRAEFDRLAASAGMRAAVGLSALAQAGVTVGRVDTEPRPGLPFAAERDRVRALTALLVWDTLDDRTFPTGGSRLSLSFDHALPGLGAARKYWRAEGLAHAAARRGAFVTQAHVRLAASGGRVPAHALFRVGGPVFLPGRHRDELWGRQALGFGISQTLLAGPLRLTARAGAGATWEERRQVRLGGLIGGGGFGIEYPTPVGPINAELGFGQGGRRQLYFSIGFR